MKLARFRIHEKQFLFDVLAKAIHLFIIVILDVLVGELRSTRDPVVDYFVHRVISGRLSDGRGTGQQRFHLGVNRLHVLQAEGSSPFGLLVEEFIAGVRM